MRRLLLTIAFCLLASPAWAAITFDTFNTGEGTTSATTASLTVAADANLAIICVATRESGGAVGQAASASFGGEAATWLAGAQQADNITRIDLFYKLAPLTGSQTATGTGIAGTDWTITGAMTFKGVAQTNTFNTPKPASSSSATMDTDTILSAVGEVVVLCGAIRTTSSLPTASADATPPVSVERFEDINSGTGSAISGIGYTEDGAATSINMRVDLSASANWASAAVSMRPLASTRRPIAPMLFQ